MNRAMLRIVRCIVSALSHAAFFDFGYSTRNSIIFAKEIHVSVLSSAVRATNVYTTAGTFFESDEEVFKILRYQVLLFCHD